MSMSRRARLSLVLAGVLAAVPAAAIIVLLNYDWNRARPWLNDKVSAALERPFEIRGDLSLSWRRQGPASAGRGWSDWSDWSDWRNWRADLPLPHLRARDVYLGNPAGLAPGPMASASEFSFALNLLPLLARRISIPMLRFSDPKVLLQRGADGKHNWNFRRQDQPSRWQLDLHSVVFTKGSVTYVDAVTEVQASATLDTIADPLYGVAWTLNGSWRGQPISGSGKAGAVLSLQQQARPFPLQARLQTGGTSVTVQGTLTKPADLAALDLRLQLSGTSLARLYALTGVLLPETPAFATEGHLSATLREHASTWVYDRFTGRVGASDIGGRLAYQTGQPLARPLLSGDIRSRLLQFSDLGALIGADSNASKTARGVDEQQPGNRVLPVETFKTARWTALDAQVGFKAERLIRGKELPIHHVATVVRMQDGVLDLTPLQFDLAGGTWTSNITLDGSGKLSPDAIRATLTGAARGLQLKQLFPAIEGMQATVGQVNADVTLSATGNSVASLLGAANGELKSVVRQGSVSKLLLEKMGLNLGNVVLTKLAGDRQIKLNCMVSDFSVTQGLMRSRLFVADTEEARLSVDGTVNLANEQLDLTLRPDSKSLRVFSLRAPLYVTGTFKQPAISVDKTVLALRAGGALALAAVAPVTAIVPLIHAAPGATSGCAALLAQAGGRPVAPPPGKMRPAQPAK